MTHVELSGFLIEVTDETIEHVHAVPLADGQRTAIERMAQQTQQDRRPIWVSLIVADGTDTGFHEPCDGCSLVRRERGCRVMLHGSTPSVPAPGELRLSPGHCCWRPDSRSSRE